MRERSCELHFAGTADIQLIKVLSTDPVTQTQNTTVRGKTPGAFRSAGTLQWTSAVRGLCILFVQAKLVHLLGKPETEGVLSGERASPASSLDYAISKQPAWISEMFGPLPNGDCAAKRLIYRTNPERKRPGPVALLLNQRVLSADAIYIVWNGRTVDGVDALETLLLKLRGRRQADFLDTAQCEVAA